MFLQINKILKHNKLILIYSPGFFFSLYNFLSNEFTQNAMVFVYFFPPFIMHNLQATYKQFLMHIINSIVLTLFYLAVFKFVCSFTPFAWSFLFSSLPL